MTANRFVENSHAGVLTAVAVLMLANLTFAGCTSSSEEQVADYADAPIGFSVEASDICDDNAATRGETVAAADVDEIGIFAFYQKAKSNGYPTGFSKSAGEPNYMYNQQLCTADGGATWSYIPCKYWPNNTGDQLSFFAYAPYNAATAWEDLEVVANTAGTAISRTFLIDDDVQSQIDYLCADPVLNQSRPASASGNISFSFTHVCARVGFSLGINDGSGNPAAWTYADSTITVTGITLNGVHSSFTYRLQRSAGSLWTGSVTALDGSQDISLSGTNLQNATISNTTYTTAACKQLNASDSWLFLAPEPAGLSITLTYTVSGPNTSTATKTHTFSLPTPLTSSSPCNIKLLL